MFIATLLRALSVSRSALAIMGAAGRVSAATRNRTAPADADLKILGIDEMPNLSRV